MNIIVQTTGGDASSLNCKIESPNRTLANVTRAILLKSSHKKNSGVLYINIPYGSTAELKIDCVLMFLTLYGTE